MFLLKSDEILILRKRDLVIIRNENAQDVIIYR